jgi:hypothetical protein
MKRITDPDFRYVPAIRTDIRRTFARVRREMARTRAASGTVLPLLPAQRAVQQRLDNEDLQARRRGRTT